MCDYRCVTTGVCMCVGFHVPTLPSPTPPQPLLHNPLSLTKLVGLRTQTIQKYMHFFLCVTTHLAGSCHSQLEPETVAKQHRDGNAAARCVLLVFFYEKCIVGRLTYAARSSWLIHYSTTMLYSASAGLPTVLSEDSPVVYLIQA